MTNKTRTQTITRKKQNGDKTMIEERKPIVVAVSGGFDMVHKGHILLFKEARMLGDKLVVILNNDNWLRAKKGYTIMDETDRKTILESIRYIDEVLISYHDNPPADMSVCAELSILKPDIFANGGDKNSSNIPERGLCKELGIKMVDNIGGKKIRSSSKMALNGNSTD